MSKRRFPLTHRRQRSILTDMLPFEVPPTFSNRGFFIFLRDNGIEIEGGRLYWRSGSPALYKIIRILFGIKDSVTPECREVGNWGKVHLRKSVPLSACKMDTIPFNFRVAHNLDGRVLSVAHPRNQVEVAGFYADYSATIVYYTSLSEFSIRRPVSVSRFAFYQDKLHQTLLEKTRGGLEEDGKEYEQLGSYFVYKKYRNIHRFFESYKYHRCEKKYDAMVQIDIGKCFDSIYTHSLPWAVIGKSQTKFHLEESKSTFAGRFDAVMQGLNQRETNGIVIGPEFSRVFAEIILQSIDTELLQRLAQISNLKHKIDYEIFRYVDDYFLFFNEASTELKTIETLQDILKAKKLSINTAKIKRYEKPIITEITIAKQRISTLLNTEIAPSIDEIPATDPSASPALRLSCELNTNRLIIRYKTAIKESGVKYGDLLNYTFAVVENKIDSLLRCYTECDMSTRDQRRLLYSLRSIMEFSFFVYSASPKVNHTIRICRMISTSIDFLHSKSFQKELKHVLFKYIHDNILQQLEKNVMSPYREVESLYLLVALSQTGKEYWLPETTLLKHFMITENEKTKSYERLESLNYFSITVLLSYIKEKLRYNRLRDFLEAHAIAKMTYMKAHYPGDAEGVMLLLDLITCPFVSKSTKTTLANLFEIDASELTEVQDVNDHWFTAWGDKFNLGKELDAKRSREVY